MMDQPTVATLARRLDRVERENRRLIRLGGLTLSFVLLFPVALLAAGGLRSNYEAPYRGQPLQLISMELVNIVCESDLADSTGYYTTPDGTILQSVLKKQRKRAVWIISVRGHEATVTSDQGDLVRFQITKRNQSGLVFANVENNVSTQVITIDPKNSSFVYSTQNVHPLWNRANVFVGRCRLGGP